MGKRFGCALTSGFLEAGLAKDLCARLVRLPNVRIRSVGPVYVRESGLGGVEEGTPRDVTCRGKRRRLCLRPSHQSGKFSPQITLRNRLQQEDTEILRVNLKRCWVAKSALSACRCAFRHEYSTSFQDVLKRHVVEIPGLLNRRHVWTGFPTLFAGQQLKIDIKCRDMTRS